MSLTMLLIAGVVTGLLFDVVVLEALCFGITLIGVGCAAGTGDWRATTTLGLGVLVLQIGFLAGIFVSEWESHARSRESVTRKPRD